MNCRLPPPLPPPSAASIIANHLNIKNTTMEQPPPRSAASTIANHCKSSQITAAVAIVVGSHLERHFVTTGQQPAAVRLLPPPSSPLPTPSHRSKTSWFCIYCTFDLNWQPGPWNQEFCLAPSNTIVDQVKKIRSLTQGMV